MRGPPLGREMLLDPLGPRSRELGVVYEVTLAKVCRELDWGEWLRDLPARGLGLSLAGKVMFVIKK